MSHIYLNLIDEVALHSKIVAFGHIHSISCASCSECTLVESIGIHITTHDRKVVEHRHHSVVPDLLDFDVTVAAASGAGGENSDDLEIHMH